MNIKELSEKLKGHELDEKISKLICGSQVEEEKKRYLGLLNKAYELFSDGDYHVLSAPGRSEIGGNHTDHQNGRVIAASVNADTVAVVKKNDTEYIHLTSLGFDLHPIDVSDLSVHEEEAFHTEALVRGIAARFKQLGYQIGGFDGVAQSNVPVGSGISSSASFEVLCAEIMNHLFNGGKISPIEIAQIAQYAENEYFKKPCGLLDQMAISCGGFTYMDFKDKDAVMIEKLNFNFKDYGYFLVLTNTQEDHADLSDEYAAISQEMRSVAAMLGAEVLSQTDKSALIANLSDIKEKMNNDRALLRALHFFNENERVTQQAEAIKSGNIDRLLELMRESGHSSMQLLQNIYCAKQPNRQALSVALALSEDLIGTEGAFRIHGGGFGGTIQAVVNEKMLDRYLTLMQQVFGKKSTFIMNIRSVGGCKII